MKTYTCIYTFFFRNDFGSNLLQLFGGDVCLEHIISSARSSFHKTPDICLKFEAAEHRCAAKCGGHGIAKVQP